MTTTVAETAWERGRFDARGGPSKVLFGRMYEDASIELGAFRPGGRIFCIASAGCTAMKLAPRHEVVAVDINPGQLAYAERRFAGAGGVRGTAERVMAFGRAFAPLVGWWPSRVRAFLDLDDPAEQIAFWRRHLDTRRFRTALDGFLSVTALRAVYASPFLDFLPRRLGDGHARAHGALLRPAPQPHEPLRPRAAPRRAVRRAAAAGGERDPPRPRRRCRVSRARARRQLRRVHALEHPGRGRRGLRAAALRRGEARRRAGRGRGAPELRARRRSRCRPTAPPRTGRCSGASST